jgi:hypothetical protein
MTSTIFISILNSLLIAGRGYLMLNLFAMLQLLVLLRLKKYINIICVMLLCIFLLISYSRDIDGGLVLALNSLEEYLLMPILGITIIYKSNFTFDFECYAFISKEFYSHCNGLFSGTILSTPSINFVTNVSGVVGESIATMGLFSIIPIGYLFGTLTIYFFNIRHDRSLYIAIGFYLWSVMSIFYFYTDFILQNNIFFILFLITLIRYIYIKIMNINLSID